MHQGVFKHPGVYVSRSNFGTSDFSVAVVRNDVCRKFVFAAVVIGIALLQAALATDWHCIGTSGLVLALATGGTVLALATDWH